MQFPLSIVLVSIALSGPLPAQGALPGPGRLRTEYLGNPLGLDTPKPRFGWWMRHTERDQVQTAYQILVADSPQALEQDKGNIWDSGPVASDNSVHVEYGGPPLRSFTRYHWKVRVWDGQGRVSAWSEPAWFEMALLEPTDFVAKWIRGPKDEPDATGFYTVPANEPDKTQSVNIDLKYITTITKVVLYPARPQTWWVQDQPGFGFPVRYKVELAQKPDFSDAILVVDKTQEDQPNPGENRVELPVDPPQKGRYLRLTAAQLASTGEGTYQLALAELEVIDPSGANVALRKPVQATWSIEEGAIGAERLVDGVRRTTGKRRFSPMLRTEFELRGSVARARAYVSGLGYYELYINGARVGDHVLDPANTVHAKRTLYSVYDVTELLRKQRGASIVAVGMMLGHGWHRDSCAAWLQLRIEYEDGRAETVVTDESWRWSLGAIVEESLYHGEAYDARLEKGGRTWPYAPGWADSAYHDSDWQPAALYESPPARMVAQVMPPIRVTERRRPVSITRLPEGSYIVDFGQNLTGWVRLDVEGPVGTKVTIRHAELLNPDGTLNPANLRSARATDVYILKGDGLETYRPHFTQHGFRYAEVIGYPGELTADRIEAEVFHTDYQQIGHFESTSPLLNNIRDITLWSIRGNSMSIPTDCPQRDERMGWMGDAHLAGEPTMLTFDTAAYYENWLRVIADSQDEAGHVPDTAPPAEYGEAEGSPPWAVAYPLVTWYLYRYYGDVRAVAEHYDNLVRWFGTLEGHAKDHIVEYCRYGDWVGLEDTPGPLISSGVYYWTAKILREFAEVLSKPEDVQRWDQRMGEIREAFHARFFDREKGFYGNGSQYSQIWPLYLGIVPEDVRANVLGYLVRDILEKRHGHLATGILGTKYVFDVLTEAGRADVAYYVALQEGYPSWGYMLNHGATTLWELWGEQTTNRMNSHNHQMFGSILGWFYGGVAGIRTLPEPGYRQFTIAPVPTDSLAGAKAILETVRGPLVCDWREDENRFVMRVSIPANSRARVIVPRVKDRGTLLLDGLPADRAAWQGQPLASGTGFDLGSGEYVFSVE